MRIWKMSLPKNSFCMLASPLMSRTSKFFRLRHSLLNCETMPRNYPVCFSSFNQRQHFCEFHSTGLFGGFGLAKRGDNFQFFFGGILFRLSDNCHFDDFLKIFWLI